MRTLPRLRQRLLMASLLGGLTVIFLCPVPTFAKAQEETQPLLLADMVDYDEERQVVTAIGNVELSLNDKRLRADKITYNKMTDVVTATGHVAMTENSGEVLYADKAEVTSDMKQGFIDRLGILFPDQSRLVANDAQRYEGRYLVTDYGVYSSCSLCADDPTKPPLWQLKGKRVTHDSVDKNVIYRDATVEFTGIPVFYMPYFSHPDPSVSRRQGFLSPSAGMDNTLGTFVKTPYYFDLAPNSDLVMTPNFNTTDTVQMQADWRYRFSSGEMKWSGSLTRADFVDEDGDDKGERLRGHLFGTGRYDLTNTWRAGTQIALTTDKSYLPRYGIPYEDILVNRAYLENFTGRNYAVINSYYFEDLRPGDQLAEPIVAPEIRYSALGAPNRTFGGRWSFDSSLLVTSRDNSVDLTKQGANTRRLSLDAGWERQIVSQTGFLTTVEGQVRADGYWADHVPDPNLTLGSSFSDVTYVRPFTQGTISLRYPLGRHGAAYQQILEPITVLAVAPNVSNSRILPNEDSIGNEFDETNLFSSNHFAGQDRVEGGIRTAYGLRHAIIGDNGGRIEMVGGQIFRLKKDAAFSEDSGLRQNSSDYVGRVDLIPSTLMDANYGFRLDPHNLQFSKQEVQASAGPEAFRPYGNYLFVEQYDTSTLENERIEETTLGFKSKFKKFWTLSVGHTQAIQPSPGPRSTKATLMYEDECFSSGITAKRDYTSRLDVEAGSSVLFQFYLKNIGGFSTE